MNKFLEKTNPFFIGFLVFVISAQLPPIASRALFNPVFMLIPILLGVVTGRIHCVLKNKKESGLCCPKCRTVNFTWKVKPERVEVVEKSEVYLKEISEEVGFTETDTYGEIFILAKVALVIVRIIPVLQLPAIMSIGKDHTK